MSDASGLVVHFFRHEYGRVVSALVRRFGTQHLELIEDSVQSAIALALTSWSLRGQPDNPGAWLTTTARNAVLDQLRRTRSADRLLDRGLGNETSYLETDAPLSEELDDPALRMLFVVADPRLSEEYRLVLALKILCGFSIREISLRLFVGEEAIKKRLQRARRSLAELAPDLDGPRPASLPERLPSVHRVLYLLFNEGYSSTKEHEHLRVELCEEAIRLCAQLHDHPRCATGSTWALTALMTFHHARRDARHDDDGTALLLEEQDRTRWHWPEIGMGMKSLQRASATRELSRYHVEAAILAEHCSAPSYAETNWIDIVRLYDVLIQLNPSPLHRLNRAVALAEVPSGHRAPFPTGPAAALADLNAATPPAWLSRHYLWDATLGELHRRTGNLQRARTHLEAATRNAPTQAEAKRIRRKLDSLGAR